MLDVGAANIIVLDEISTQLGQLSSDNINVGTTSSDLAYVIYTSGSTGKPKGVMVEHRNVANFFAGMDSCIGTDPGTWLAVTSISFDISVLELFWTLSRGFKVVLYSDKSAYGGAEVDTTSDVRISKPMDFSLFYWNVATEESHHLPDKYKLLIEGAKFADNNGFKAVWNPERHFASFGGLFPNPSVTCAALATVTTNVDLRAGSCVVPLHSPIRVAEEWAVVDNLSNGRVGIAVASGWAPPDFAIKPENFKESKSIMFDSLDKVRRLWRGETLTFDGPTGEVEVRTLPRPIQKELPYWVTTAGNVETFRSAAEAGANVLTHLLGQTFEEVKEKVDAYRSAWKEAGHEGEGTITLMLHTLIGNDMDEVEDIVRQPMKEYLRSAMFLVKGAAWNFPTFKKMSEETGKSLDEFFETISDEDMDDLLEFAFQRYFRTSGLFGTPDSAVETVAKCDEIGVDEIACLIDFGIDTDVVMQQLPFLEMLKSKCAKLTSIPLGAASDKGAEEDFTIPALIEKHNVTHFQCTPSMATMLVSDPESKKSLGQLKHMMVGGEALTPALAESLLTAVNDRVTNMYGPTETTIWSSTSDVKLNQAVTIGTAIANTQIYIVDNNLKALPAGVAGELVIGGDGVVRGYYNRPELTSERFVEDFKLTPSSAAQRVYRTGDLARFDSDGQLACLGRIDHQVKIRGYRIELGEIEALLQAHDSVRECAVILREDKAGDKRLVAYARPGFQQHLDVGVLKSSLSEQLPDFMVPSVFVELTEMPLTPNGKVDRNALPEPIQQKHTQGGEFALPENEWEDLIADIWKRALGVPEVGRKDNFFDIGGHSLLVIQVLKDLRDSDKVSRQVQMTDLFRHTTVEALAKFVASGGDESVEAVSEVASSRVAARKAAMNRRRRR
jgi:natural product biosynthesis luciferase-like monooxygenase protein